MFTTDGLSRYDIQTVGGAEEQFTSNVRSKKNSVSKSQGFTRTVIIVKNIKRMEKMFLPAYLSSSKTMLLEGKNRHRRRGEKELTESG